MNERKNGMNGARRAVGMLAIAVLSLVGTPHAAAEDLVQVYELAQGHDAALMSARVLARSAEPRAAQANALLLPRVTASGGYTNATTNQSAISDPMAGAGGAVSDPNLSKFETHTTTWSLNVRMPLFDRVASADVAKAGTGLDLARTELEITLQAFVVRVAQAYFDVLSAEDVLATTRSSKTSIAGQLDSAQRNFDAGTGIVTDVRDAQARFDLAVSQEISAENELRVRRLMLERLVGRRGLTPRPLAVPVVLPPIEPADVGAWVEAGAVHPGIRRARLTLDSAALDVRRANAEHLPTVAAVGSVSGTRNGGSGAVYLPGRSTNTSLGVELNVPLFSGFATQNRIAEALLLEEKARDDLEDTVRSVTEATQRAYFDLQTGRAQVTALEAAERSSRLSLEGTELGYRAGVRLNLDVLNAQTLLFQTRRDLAKARYDALMANLKLRLAAGRLVPEDLVAINRMLAP